MRYIIRIVMSVAALGCAVVTAHAHDYGNDKIKVDHPWVRPTISTITPGAAYLRIENTGDTDDTLLAVIVPEEIADVAELHESVIENNIARMRNAPGGMALPAGGSLVFEPRGKHIMLIGLQERLTEGMKFDGVLVFEDAGRVDVEFWVEQPKGDDQEGGHHEHH